MDEDQKQAIDHLGVTLHRWFSMGDNIPERWVDLLNRLNDEEQAQQAAHVCNNFPARVKH